MNANRQYDASKPGRRIPISGNTEKAALVHNEISSRFTRELGWVLISVLLLLYVVTTYVYWAKT